MKVAITAWQGRVAPVFDVAGTVFVVDSSTGSTDGPGIGLSHHSPHLKIAELEALQVEVLICGAISRRVRECIEARGIRVHAFVSGAIDDVVDAWRAGKLEQTAFAMPGCRRCRRRQGNCNGRREN